MSLNVDEILHPEKHRRSDLNRSAGNENDEPDYKRVRLNEDQESLLRAADELEIEVLDERNVKKMLSTFEKRVLKNQEMRTKFSDQPEKFMDSEVELNVAVQELHALATVPQFYNQLNDGSMIQQFLYLLNHDNTDISCAVVHLLQELTDIDTLTENEEAAETMADILIEGQLLGALVKNLERLDELNNKDEADGVYNTLAVVENIFEFKADQLPSHLIRNGFLTWLLKRLKAKLPFDSNTMYCSEILSVLLQNSDLCKKSIGQDFEGVDTLLQLLASYKRHNPQNSDEIEHMENLFNCLCACLMEKSNLSKFLDGEGLQLMNLMLREKKMSRQSALKVLNYAMTGKASKPNCDKFADILGLRTLFPLFMKTPSKHKRKGHTAEEHEEHVTGIVCSLLRYCSPAQRQRVLSKFTEGDCEKVERVMELHFKYLDKVTRFDAEIEKRLKLKRQQQREEEEEDEDEEEEIYLKRLDAGLFTLQQIDLIVAEICGSAGSVPAIKERVQKILSMKNSSAKVIRNILNIYLKNLSDDPDSNEDKVHINSLLAKL